MPVPRLRMFAGPNGSGKSTLKTVLEEELLGIYLNPDEIEKELRTQGFIDLKTYGVSSSGKEAGDYFSSSQLLRNTGHSGLDRLVVREGMLEFGDVAVDSYVAAVLVAFLRRKLVERNVPLTLETVMSHPSKIDILKQAQAAGYRTYLYFIATEDPEINVSRVHNRVRLGGHPVPEDKIASRYHRSLDLLMDAIANTNRAYIFDNSGENQKRTWVAEITNGTTLELKTDQVPAWFKRVVLDKIPSGPIA